jgi:hypothetical protein
LSAICAGDTFVAGSVTNLQNALSNNAAKKTGATENRDFGGNSNFPEQLIAILYD